ncbi:UDP-glycosyltransferase 73D1-like [Phragmites australis]|uniref:UDP-glycosyltransferase 73D1-like n=1 Tax=Phragmites australis TaxID=29695 RepID=UPI002D77DAD8|nr:UDP-glycosyltransferase 73D1-like [Phragmites australis]XP_062183694.1 UDP-glycosyltransferase 73D1-like [Phragmites australis]XP_062183695.1 UDP-glycosyltransferase 73D1-like [Phragmites australis]XP_062183696.1 UDP-glycosyltransferase 73D1-like [Phragmites australis]XP_062183697.1 UDP-glycosyltransferase 73D1-like [Phragmites australis]
MAMETTLTSKPDILVIPWPATSHMIPIVDIGCLLAAHGAAVTIITTPASAQLVRSRVDRTAQGSTGVTVTVIPFPAAEAGLPDGCERLDHVPSPGLVPNFFDATSQFGVAVAQHSRAMAPCRPTCIVAGMCNTWALGIARELGAPCFIFHGFGAFALLCCEYLNTHKPHEAVASLDELFDVPVLPPFECKFARRQLPLQFLPSCSIGEDSLRELREFEMAVDGIVVNSFEELEHGSAAHLAAATGKTVLAVGPISLSGAPGLLDSRADSDDARRCMAWLDAKKAMSVLYVSFGSAGRMLPAQLMQLGLALVSCSWPVLWVIKGADSLPNDTARWLRENTDADGLPESQCLVVRGWAPQVAILEHSAVGGFVTHCGWGSTLESVAAGVPMVAWPFTAEQFLNEKLIVDVLGIGVSVGVTKPTEGVLTGARGGGGEPKPDVGMEQVKKALNKLMDGAEAEERRRKTQELKAKAKAALEHGGSSYMNLKKLIQFAV